MLGCCRERKLKTSEQLPCKWLKATITSEISLDLDSRVLAKLLHKIAFVFLFPIV